MSTDQTAERLFCYLCDGGAPEINESRENHDEACCLASHPCGYGCTRPRDHSGAHEATTSRVRIAARWSA